MYNFLDEFSKKLREKRNFAKQTQKGLAAKMGMSHRTIMDRDREKHCVKVNKRTSF